MRIFFVIILAIFTLVVVTIINATVFITRFLFGSRVNNRSAQRKPGNMAQVKESFEAEPVGRFDDVVEIRDAEYEEVS